MLIVFVLGIALTGGIIVGLLYWRHSSGPEALPVEVSVDPLDPIVGRVRIPTSADSKVQVVELERGKTPTSPPERASFIVEDDDPLVADLDEHGLPTTLQGTDGSSLRFEYLPGSQVRITVTAANGKTATTTQAIPKDLQNAIDAQRARYSGVKSGFVDSEPNTDVLGAIESALIGTAHAEVVECTANRAVQVNVRVEDPNGALVSRGVRLSLECTKLGCRQTGRWTLRGGRSQPTMYHSVTRAIDVKPPSNFSAMIRECEQGERTSNNTLAVIGGMLALGGLALTAGPVVAIIGATAGKVSIGVGVAGLLGSVASYSGGSLCVDNMLKLAGSAQLAEQLAGERVSAKICASHPDRSGGCASFSYAPFGFRQARASAGNITLRLGPKRSEGEPPANEKPADGDPGRLPAELFFSGKFDLTQSDSGCSKSRAPATFGPPGSFKITVNRETGIISGTLKTSGGGTRNGLSCKGDTFSLSWRQSYRASFRQTVSKEKLAGGTISINLTGTLSGNGGGTLSNCKKGNKPIKCPAGGFSSYSYPVTISGKLDLDRRLGAGKISVSKIGLSTRGTWTLL